MRTFRAFAALSLFYFAVTLPAASQHFVKMGEIIPLPFGVSAYCREKPHRCTPSSPRFVHMTHERWRELAHVNAAVNDLISPFVDRSATSIWRKWRDDVLVGPCTDYVLTKRSMLIDRGWPSGALLIARGTVPNGDMHAVLLVATSRGHVVLDNLRSAILPYRSLPYRWHDIAPPENPREWRRIISWLRLLPGANFFGLWRGECASHIHIEPEWWRITEI